MFKTFSCEGRIVVRRTHSVSYTDPEAAERMLGQSGRHSVGHARRPDVWDALGQVDRRTCKVHGLLHSWFVKEVMDEDRGSGVDHSPP
jgi:hypothetical protein